MSHLRTLTCLALSSIASLAQGTESWPTHLHDNSRSGHTNSELSAQLSAQWVFTPNLAPKEAWPGTAQSDHWRKRNSPEKKRITFDKAFSPVSADGKVYFGSSADDQLYCLDLKTGKHDWSFFADAPIRLSPTLVDNKVIFGADDGLVYCLESNSGKLIWKSGLPQASKEWLPGNNRVISLYPIRTGVMVQNGTAYFGCGLFPDRAGAWYCSLDISNGKTLDHKPIEKSLQGYLESRGGKLLAPTGRDPKQHIIDTLFKTDSDSAKKSDPLLGYIYSSITTPSYSICGGNGEVAMFELATKKLIWKAKVTGIARNLAIANGNLLVSTDAGHIHCFGSNTVRLTQQKAHYRTDSLPKELPAILQLTSLLPTTKGYALVRDADADRGKFLLQLAQSTELQIIALTKSDQATEALRHSFAARSLYGSRVNIYTQPKTLPFRPRMFNLITSASKKAQLNTATNKALLRPGTGILWTPDMNKAIYRAPELKGAGEWTHMYADPANTACSGDTLVGSKLSLQWFGRPGPQHIIDRHLRASPPLVKNGLLIVPGNDYLLCVDGWNGTILWEKPVSNIRRIGALRNSGNLVLTDDILYCASGSDCLALDVYSGEQKFKIPLPKEFESAGYEWGYLASVGSGLIGSAVKEGTTMREMSPASIYSAGYGDNTNIACSDTLFALNRHSVKPFWSYSPKGVILNPSITISNNRVCFIESLNPATLKKTPARLSYKDLIDQSGAELVCLDLITGTQLWRTPVGEHKEIQTLFVVASNDKVILCNSRNHLAEGAEHPTVHYDIRAYEISSGKLNWQKLHNNFKRPNSDHGEQDLHPAIIGDRILAEPYIYNINTGESLGKFNRNGGGCGTISASNNSLFFRAQNLATLNLKDNKVSKITSVSRPGCWINMIPASGLLLVPEGSSGCICGFAVQGSMGFAPVL